MKINERLLPRQKNLQISFKKICYISQKKLKKTFIKKTPQKDIRHNEKNSM